MAEAGPPPTTVLCRYYMHGVCREGDKCRFSHNRIDAPSRVCTYYQRGNCSFGNSCRYDHVKPQRSQAKSLPQRRAGPVRSEKQNVTLSGSNVLPGKMTSLKKHTVSESSDISNSSDIAVSPPAGKSVDEWVKAKEFIPREKHLLDSGPLSYATAVVSEELRQADKINTTLNDSDLLCPYVNQGSCPYEEQCTYLHGDICDMCGLPVLHPHNLDERDKHIKECVAEHEKDMEISFAVAKSKDKSCGICMDVIMEKESKSERRFGILPNCNHVFCLSCIRKWRSAKQFEHKIVRACPECRVKSDFVTPSDYWVDTESEKQQLIEKYKDALSNRPCKYFNYGKGDCPFYDKCFYLHANPDGTKADLPPRPRRSRVNAEGDLDIINRILLWDFFENRQESSFLAAIELELNNIFDLAGLYISSDDDSEDDIDISALLE